jgi:hypothetical protein
LTLVVKPVKFTAYEHFHGEAVGPLFALGIRDEAKASY